MDFVAYGNEAELAHTYGDVVLIARVGGHEPVVRESKPSLSYRQRKR